jgi:hypothetical protein
MLKVTGKGLRILKFLHFLGTMCWIGGIICSFGLLLQSNAAPNRECLIYLFTLMEFLDNYIIISGALATVVIGVIYAVFTNWGLIKTRWVAIKWLLSWFIIITGSLFYFPFVGQMKEIITIQGLAAMETAAYQGLYHNFVILLISHMISVMIIVLLSTLRPKLE